MKKEKVQSLISEYFTKIVQKDRKIHNAYLLIHSEKLGIHLNIAEGSTGIRSANEKNRGTLLMLNNSATFYNFS